MDSIGKYIRDIKDRVLKKQKVDFLFLISVISLVKCLMLFFIIEILLTPGRRIGYFPDSLMYERISDNILSGHGFSLSVSLPFKPTMFKEPLYSFFIALIKSLPFGSIDSVVFIQILLNPLIAIIGYFIGKEVFNERIARLSSLLVALIPIYGEISFFIMPEFIFIVLLSVTILCLTRAVKSMSLIWFILSGFLLGLSSLCRNVTLPLFLIYLVIILFKNKKDIKRGLVLKLVIFILSFSIVTTPWMVRNQQKLGLFSISRRGGELLSHQAAWAANFSLEEWKAYSLYLLSGRLAQKLYPQIIGNDLGEYEYRILLRTAYVDQLLQKYKEGKVERVLIRQAIRDIMCHPFRFLLLSMVIYVQVFKYFESIALMLIKGSAGVEWMLSLARFFLFIIGLAYTLFALQGILYSRKLFDYSLILVTIVYFHIVLTIIGIIPGGLQRHILPITVFYSFFVVIAIDKKDAYTFS